MTPRRVAIVSIVLALCCASHELRAQSDVVPATDEASVYEDESGNNAGADSEVCIGNQATTTTTRRAFVRYVLPVTPAGTTVARVVLQVQQLRVRRTGGPLGATLEVRRAIANWVEGAGSGPSAGPCDGGSDAPGVDWTAQPAVAAPSASATLPPTDDVSVVFDTDVGTGDDALIADVQAWLDNGATNFGWRLSVSSAGEATTNNARSLLPGTLTIFYAAAPVDFIFGNGFE